MEEVKNTLQKLKNIIVSAKSEKNNNKISLYDLKILIKLYKDLENREKTIIYKSIGRKLNRTVNIYIDNNKVIVLLDQVNKIVFEIKDDDVTVIENHFGIPEPLKLIGREVLNYYNLVYPVETLNGNIITDKAIFSFYKGSIINVTLKDTDLTFENVCFFNNLKFDYNSLKIIEFIKENEDDLLKSILIDKKDIPTLDIIKTRIKKPSIVLNDRKYLKKKKSFFKR